MVAVAVLIKVVYGDGVGGVPLLLARLRRRGVNRGGQMGRVLQRSTPLPIQPASYVFSWS